MDANNALAYTTTKLVLIVVNRRYLELTIYFLSEMLILIYQTRSNITTLNDKENPNYFMIAFSILYFFKGWSPNIKRLIKTYLSPISKLDKIDVILSFEMVKTIRLY